MSQSEQIGELAAAFAAAQAEMKNPAFDSENPAFKSGFASLAAVRNAVVPSLAKHGIAAFQSLSLNDVGVSCETTFVHKSGQYITLGPMTVPITKRDAWSVAGAATYAKRIAFQAAAVVVGDADDDGAAAQASQGHTKASPRDGLDLESVDQELATQYALDIRKALVAADEAEVKRLHETLKSQYELYVVIGDKLTSKERSDLRKIVSKKEGA